MRCFAKCLAEKLPVLGELNERTEIKELVTEYLVVFLYALHLCSCWVLCIKSEKLYQK